MSERMKCLNNDGECSSLQVTNREDIALHDRKSGSVKVEITALQQPLGQSQQRTLTHLVKRDPVELAFHDLTYKVTEGRKKSEYKSCFIDCLYNICAIRKRHACLRDVVS